MNAANSARDDGGVEATIRRFTPMQRSVLTWAHNAHTERGLGSETFVANENEKRAVVQLEKRGLVAVRRTKQMTAGLTDWWVKLSPTGLKLMGGWS